MKKKFSERFKHMANCKKWVRVASCAVIIALVATMLITACVTLGGSATNPENSFISLVDKDINKNLDKYLNSEVLYKLPDGVKDSDEISIIIQTKKTSLLDAYDATDKSVSFTEFAYSEAADKVEKDILEANKDLTFYKRVQDTYITTKEFEINSTRKVIRSKVIDRYNAEKNK